MSTAITVRPEFNYIQFSDISGVAPPTCSFYDIPCWLISIVDNFIKIYNWIFLNIIEFFVWLDASFTWAVWDLVNRIEVPTFMVSAGTLNYDSLLPEMLWLPSFFALPFGVGIFATAYTARFLIRRIWFIN